MTLVPGLYLSRNLRVWKAALKELMAEWTERVMTALSLTVQVLMVQALMGWWNALAERKMAWYLAFVVSGYNAEFQCESKGPEQPSQGCDSDWMAQLLMVW